MPAFTRSAWLAVVWMTIVVSSYLFANIRTDMPRLLVHLTGAQ